MPALRKSSVSETTGMWSAAEHERFLEAIAQHPQGPWRLITDHVGTRSIKQVQTHAQKYQQKLLRHQRGLRKTKTKVVRPEHRVDTTTVEQFTSGCIVRKAYSQTRPVSSGSPAPSSVSYSSDSSLSSSALFSSMMDMLSEAADITATETHGVSAVDGAHYGHAYGFVAYCEPSAAQYSYNPYSYQAPLGSGVEPLPYTYGYSAPSVEWSEPEALALRETLDMLLV